MSRTPAFRKIAAGGAALALTATGAAMLASPANAATSPSLTYTCHNDALGDFAVSATHAFGDTVGFGGELPVTSTLTLPESVVGALNFFGVKKVDGTSGVPATLNGTQIQTDQAFPKTDVPASGTMNVVATGVADTAPAGGVAQAGDVADLAMVDTAASDLTAQIYTYDASDAQGGPFVVGCELDDSQTLTVGTVTITQATTETASKLTYKAKTDKLIGKATVTAPDSGASPQGEVKMVLKRNGKVVSSQTKTLNSNGIATLTVADAKNGDYKLVAKYLGDEAGNFTTSGSTATKSVG
jgi:hypothetical protein